MAAGAGSAEFAHDPAGTIDQEDAAVADVGDHEESVRQQVGVVRVGQVARSGAGDTRMAIGPDDPVAAEVDQADRLIELLVDRDAGVAGREERVVGVVERLPGSDVARARELPDDSLARRDEQDPVVVAVGDQHVSRNRAGLHGRQPEDGLRGRWSGRRLPSGAGADFRDVRAAGTLARCGSCRAGRDPPVPTRP